MAGSSSQIAVFGLGYAGCVSAACLAELGNQVVGIDPDQHRVSEVPAGRVPCYEPGLEDLVRSNIANGRLTVTGSTTEALGRAGTPCEKNGDLRLDQIQRVISKPGFAFGGYCLPKDLRVLVNGANRLDLQLPMLGSILPGNHAHLARAIDAALAVPAERIGLIGLGRARW